MFLIKIASCLLASPHPLFLPQNSWLGVEGTWHLPRLAAHDAKLLKPKNVILLSMVTDQNKIKPPN